MKQDALHRYATTPDHAEISDASDHLEISSSPGKYALHRLPDRNWFNSCIPADTTMNTKSRTLSDGRTVSLKAADNNSSTISVIKDMDEFLALNAEWEELLKSSPVNNLFLTWEWLSTWWKYLAEQRKLNIIVVRRNNSIIAIAPLCMRPVRTGLLLPMQMFEFIGVGNVGSDYPDLIIRPGEEQHALQALINYMLSQQAILKFSLVLKNSCYLSEFTTLIKQQGWHALNKTTHACPIISLCGHNWASYLSSLGSSHRYNFRRRLKNLQKEFVSVRFEQVTTAQQVKATLLKLIELHNLRWDKRGGSDAFHRADLLRFHDGISQIALDKGNLRLYELKLDENVVAILYGFKYNNVFFFYQSAFDLDYSKYSVGLVIMGLTIKCAIEEGTDKYDFLHGDEEYKYLWTTQQHELEQLILIPPGFAGTTYRLTTTLLKHMKSLAHKFLPESVINSKNTHK